MKFKIEQIAIHPGNNTRSEKAEELLSDMGADEWVRDVVSAEGKVFGVPRTNQANLSFNYDMEPDCPLELEVLDYVQGESWMDSHPAGVSHLGMHCTATELAYWRDFFAARGIGVAQEVITRKHTNPAIAGIRSYKYVIFNTRPILGVDIKLIVRLEDRK